jgi:hypothetical protein
MTILAQNRLHFAAKIAVGLNTRLRMKHAVTVVHGRSRGVVTLQPDIFRVVLGSDWNIPFRPSRSAWLANMTLSINTIPILIQSTNIAPVF